jgi:tetratricopeptide (TPR) repeat protein
MQNNITQFLAFILIVSFWKPSMLTGQERPLPPTSTKEIQQQRSILEQQFEEATSDEEKVMYGMRLSGIIARENYNEGIAKAKEMLELSKATQDDELIARSYFDCANILFRNNRTDEIMTYLKAGMKAAQSHGAPDLLVNYSDLIGQIYEKWGVYEKSLMYYQQSLDTLKKYPQLPRSNIRMAVCHNRIGSLFSRTNNLPVALKNYKQAIAYAKQAKRWDMVGGNYHNMAQAYEMMGEDASAQDAYKQATKYFNQSKKKATSPAVRKSGSR